jgi:hypothetical protein
LEFANWILSRPDCESLTDAVWFSDELQKPTSISMTLLRSRILDSGVRQNHIVI